MLQPQLTISKSSSSSDDDLSEGDSKSGSQTMSSPEEGRKQSDSSLTNQSSTDESKMYHEGHEHWLEQQDQVRSMKRKVLRPKHGTPVERIFGQHNSVLSDFDRIAPAIASSTSDKAQLSRPTFNTTNEQSTKQYSSLESPDISSNLMYPGHKIDYPPVGDYSRNRQFKANSRITQYATLTRSNHSNQDYLNDPYRDQQRFHYSGPARPKSLLNDLIPQSMTSDFDNPMRRRILLNQRRPGRYNTLTGSGSKEWRQQYQYDDRFNWRLNSDVTPSNDWLQPGALIPRIDSSTLKRHSKPVAEHSAGSIVEEPAFEEREEAAL